MDYTKLYEQLPKQPVKWSVLDIQIWLQFIGLHNLYPKFKSLAIDGSCISTLTEQDLRNELGISSGIIIKKIMRIKKGVDQFSEHVRSKQAFNSVTQKSLMIDHNLMSMVVEGGKAVEEIQEESMVDEQQSEQGDRRCYELIIQQCEGQASFFSVKKDGARIGRHSTNQILILDEGVSRYHAEIKFQECKFYLRDIKSTAGTFLKIFGRKAIYDQMIVEMGSNQFQAHIVNFMLNLEVIEGPAHGKVFEVGKGKVTIGRKSTNLINFTNDQHLSNVHSTITYVEGAWFVEDMGTTNGTWERLSKESEASEYFEVGEGTVFKIGTNQTYACKIKVEQVSYKCPPNACIICYENVKDCVYMPCKHNTACIKCSKSLKECPICRIKIQDFVRIYRS